MDILFQRAQAYRPFFGGFNFNLHSKIELAEEEAALIKRYKFDQSMLVEIIQPRLVMLIVLTVLISFAILFVFFANMFGGTQGLIIAFLGACAVGYWFYHQKRETIYVKDLMHGRYFKCRSIVELARKEAYLQFVCGYLRQVIESAKHWDGDEKFAIEPLPPEEAKQMILKGPLF